MEEKVGEGIFEHRGILVKLQVRSVGAGGGSETAGNMWRRKGLLRRASATIGSSPEKGKMGLGVEVELGEGTVRLHHPSMIYGPHKDSLTLYFVYSWKFIICVKLDPDVHMRYICFFF